MTTALNVSIAATFIVKDARLYLSEEQYNCFLNILACGTKGIIKPIVAEYMITNLLSEDIMWKENLHQYFQYAADYYSSI